MEKRKVGSNLIKLLIITNKMKQNRRIKTKKYTINSNGSKSYRLVALFFDITRLKMLSKLFHYGSIIYYFYFRNQHPEDEQLLYCTKTSPVCYINCVWEFQSKPIEKTGNFTQKCYKTNTISEQNSQSKIRLF